MGKEYGFEYIKYFLDNFNKPIVIDADGLNYLSLNMSKLPSKHKLVLTPHEMEMARLTKKSVKEIRKEREKIAFDFANKHKLVLVLKGHNTIVTNGKEIYINNTGNSGMATGGSGDVLTGIITCLLGQNYDLFSAAKLGVYIHGIAGDFAKDKYGEDSLIASDIINNLPRAIKLIRESN